MSGQLLQAGGLVTEMAKCAGEQVEKLASGNGNIIGGDPEWISASQVCVIYPLDALAMAVFMQICSLLAAA